jgi:prepilin-type N-terminal cleavage/methylation domain-containing protein
MHKQYIKMQSQNGFTLIDVIVAIFIMSVALMAVIGLANYALATAAVSKDKVIAAGLAQEGIEIVRYIRDSQDDWDIWYADATIAGDHLVQYDNSSLMNYAVTPLRIDSGGHYQYFSGSNSIFYRKINLTLNPSGSEPNEIKITAEITWSEKGKQYSLTAEDRLWNWR